MDSELEVRPYRSGDEDGIVNLLGVVFDGWPHFDLSCNPLDHWRWKHLDNPLKRSVIVVATNKDEVIGCCHTLPLGLKIGDKVFPGGIGIDDAVHPDFRRRGIWNKMDELKIKEEMRSGMKIRIGFTLNPIIIKHHLRAGERSSFPHDLIYSAKIRDIELYLRMAPVKYAWLKRRGFQMLKTYNNLRDSLRTSKNTNLTRGNLISNIKGFDDRIDVFGENLKDYHTFLVEKSKDYLNWRYCDPRGGDYVIKLAEGEDRVLGYGVLRINRYIRDHPVGSIVDLLTITDRFDVAEELIVDAVSYFDREKINAVHSLVIKKHRLESLLNRHGFLNSRYRPFFSYRTYDNIDLELNKFLNSSVDKMHFAYGDFDTI